MGNRGNNLDTLYHVCYPLLDIDRLTAWNSTLMVWVTLIWSQGQRQYFDHLHQIL
jgi:hypothetical protein